MGRGTRCSVWTQGRSATSPWRTTRHASSGSPATTSRCTRNRGSLRRPTRPTASARSPAPDSTNGNAGSGWCTGDAENFVTVAPACDVPDLVSGIVSAGVERVRLTLGTGGELDLASRDLPAAFGGRRVFAGPVPGREAIRAAAALDAPGVVVARRTLGTPPGGQCPGEDQGNDNAGGDMRPTTAPLGAVPVATAAGESLVAADRGETLCVAFGALRARVCPPYTGRWAGKVRFFAAAVDPGREVTGAVVRNTAGDVIGISERGIVRRRTHRRVVAEQAGRGVAIVRRTASSHEIGRAH